MTVFTHCSKSVAVSPLDVAFVPQSSRIVLAGHTATAAGAIQVYSFEGREIKLVAEIEKRSAFKCLAFGFNHQRQMATGDFDGRLAIWDLERLELPIFTAKAHDLLINAIAGCHKAAGEISGRPEVVTGSRDGSVKVWDIRQESSPVIVINPDDASSKRDCWTVAFGGTSSVDDRAVCAGFDNGDISLFDLRNPSTLWNKNFPGTGICSVAFDSVESPNGNIFWTGLNGQHGILSIHQTSAKPTEQEQLHLKDRAKTTIWRGRVSPHDQNLFVETDSDGAVRVLRRSGEWLEEQDSLKISKYPVPAFDWSPDLAGLFVAMDFDKMVHVGFVTSSK